MAIWTNDDLDTIGELGEMHIAPRRTLRMPFLPIQQSAS